MEWLLLLPVLLFSIVLHEVAHAWVARREGDPTAERLGRITLNPIPHLDPVGSVLVPVVLALLPGSFIFGWARPVPINPANFRSPVWGDIRVSLAGIAVNLILAVLFGLALVVLVPMAETGGMAAEILVTIALYGVLINLILAVFNLIPIPPLDGSHVLHHMLPRPLRRPYQALGRYSILIILGVLFLVPGGFAIVMAPVELLFRVVVSVMGLGGQI